ncbi:MAG: glutamate dehydrogenase [Bdellovibrionales bacterium RIFOXYB1_FULL_37_110]|nr:MAG: glutamate dehydrogenase [Bdellovibrionales bacterium RIFOXYC1_FULL_37_79]OFZ58606.1 MAG: glutamate dehydrogenase [Bdellovibrionales bacterium RIFOXYB1_FULL_37_110]OFZ61732.1 MAG: glutamate dehydrogenase [Bdellovibrionales bacterium RIFOXYD1_FULL_36_51]
MNRYATEVLESLKRKYPWEEEFIQSVTEVVGSLSEVLDQNPNYKKNAILERLVEPDRTISFKVPWRDNQGNVQINNGYRVEFNNVLGPYKGGLRFHASVTLSTLKFLGFEQIFKNSLTGLLLGGGKGGSDFNPRNRTDGEIENFCQSFMMEMFRHLGPNKDVPAGDVGVGGREIGYLFGAYRRLKGSFDGVLTGKGAGWGGSILRPEATGYGATYFLKEMMDTRKDSIDGKTVAVSGFGNVCWGVVKKVNELGGRVVTLSGPDGYIYDPEGIRGEKVDYLLDMRISGRDQVADYANKFKVEFRRGKRPWEVKCDVAMPCAIQNEMDEHDAANLIKNGTKYIVEGANLPLTLGAMKKVAEAGIMYAPGKASNAGGVACSGFEMSQDALFTKWSGAQVDEALKNVMKNIHTQCYEASKEFNRPNDYVFGANVAGFRRVANAMLDQGIN